MSWKNALNKKSWGFQRLIQTRSLFLLGGVFAGGMLLFSLSASAEEANKLPVNATLTPRTVQVLNNAKLSVSASKKSEVSKAPVNIDQVDYLQEIFGTPVSAKQTAAEKAVSKTFTFPLPQSVMEDNGAPPVPSRPRLAKYDYDMGSDFSTAMSRRLLWPMRGGLVSSRFGMRWGRMHHGTDIAAPYGTPILAAADGKVVFSGWQSGYGELVILDHGNGIKTKYGHCSKLLVHTGQHVHQGEVLGKVGSTGHATGPHLHYEVIREGLASNPEQFTRRR